MTWLISKLDGMTVLIFLTGLVLLWLWYDTRREAAGLPKLSDDRDDQDII